MSETFGPQLVLAIVLAVADAVLALPTGHGTVAGEISAMPVEQLVFVIGTGTSEQPDAHIPILLGP